MWKYQKRFDYNTLKIQKRWNQTACSFIFLPRVWAASPAPWRGASPRRGWGSSSRSGRSTAAGAQARSACRSGPRGRVGWGNCLKYLSEKVIIKLATLFLTISWSSSTWGSSPHSRVWAPSRSSRCPAGSGCRGTAPTSPTEGWKTYRACSLTRLSRTSLQMETM